MKIKDLEVGMIVWNGHNVLGVTGTTLPKEFDNFEVVKVSGNYFDYEIVFKNKEERELFKKIRKEVIENDNE